MIRSTVLGLTVLAAACGGSAASPEGEESSGGDLSQYEGSVASTDVERGKEQFDSFCGDCHPDGEEDAGPSLIAEPHSPPQIRKQVRQGSGKMRPMSAARLSDDDLEAILAYLGTINAVKSL